MLTQTITPQAATAGKAFIASRTPTAPATDQFGVKPYSRPTPTVPPQRVSLTVLDAITLVPVCKMRKSSPVTAAPPLT